MEHLQIKYNKREYSFQDQQYALVKLTGNFESADAPEANSTIGDICKQNQNVALDMAELEFLASTGIGSIVGYKEILNEKKGNLILLNPSPRIFEILSNLAIPKYIPIVHDAF